MELKTLQYVQRPSIVHHQTKQSFQKKKAFCENKSENLLQLADLWLESLYVSHVGFITLQIPRQSQLPKIDFIV